MLDKPQIVRTLKLSALLLLCLACWPGGGASKVCAAPQSAASVLPSSVQNSRPKPPSEQESQVRPTFILKQFEIGQSLRMIAYGDMRFTDPKISKGTNPKVRRWLAEKLGLERPQVLMITGDMPFLGDSTADWAEYQTETASWRDAGFPVFPTIGNHEIYHDKAKGIANYLRNYPMIEGHRWYSAVLGPAEIVSLDMTSPMAAGSEQASWFAAQLEHVPDSVEFLFLLYHVPLVADTQSQMVVGIPTLDAFSVRGILEAHVAKMHAKVVVFSGHIHNYERFERHGVEYVVTGGGGAVPYPILFRGSHDLYRDPGFPVYHYLTLNLHDHQLDAEMWKVVDPDAAEFNVVVKDKFTVRANAPLVAKRKRHGNDRQGN